LLHPTAPANVATHTSDVGSSYKLIESFLDIEFLWMGRAPTPMVGPPHGSKYPTPIRVGHPGFILCLCILVLISRGLVFRVCVYVCMYACMYVLCVYVWTLCVRAYVRASVSEDKKRKPRRENRQTVPSFAKHDPT
jgi:hypothetical protein